MAAAVPNATEIARPFVKWAGGKTSILATLRRFVPAWYNRYYEPFVGGGAMFFDLAPTDAVLSDSNEELIHCYTVVRDNPEELLAALEHYKISERRFYEIRAQQPSSLSAVQRAARFVYLNKTCFNGLYRVNKRGQFNSPFGHYKQATLADEERLRAASDVLQNAELRSGEFDEIILEQAKAGDFIYFDPPYHPVSEYSDFKRYTKSQFRHEDHVRLASVFKELDKRGCILLLSNSWHEEMIRLYKEFRIETVQAPRFINCKGDRRGDIREIIVSNVR